MHLLVRFMDLHNFQSDLVKGFMHTRSTSEYHDRTRCDLAICNLLKKCQTCSEIDWFFITQSSWGTCERGMRSDGLSRRS